MTHGLSKCLLRKVPLFSLVAVIAANGQIIAQHDGDCDAGIYFYLHDRLGGVG